MSLLGCGYASSDGESDGVAETNTRGYLVVRASSMRMGCVENRRRRRVAEGVVNVYREVALRLSS